MREGELPALTLADVDFERKGIFVRHSYARLNGEDVISDPKTRRSKRFITVPDFLLEIIREYAAKLYEYQPEERLFECTKYWLKEQLERCCKRTGVKVIRLHDLRHSHAALLIHLGTPILMVSERLGHEDVETTLRTYGHLYPSATSDAVKKLNDLMR